MMRRIIDKIGNTWYGISRGGAELSGGAPHIRDSVDIKRYMFSVILALLPALIHAGFVFGSRVYLMLLISYLSGGLVELLFAVYRKQPVEEGFLVSGLVYTLSLPASLPLPITALGVIFGTFFGKELFGGTGRNVFNPALVGRMFITLSFPSSFAEAYDALSGATPLSAWGDGQLYSMGELLFAGAPGAVGEVSRILLLFGGLWLCLSRVADWKIPLSYLVSFYLLSLLHSLFAPGLLPPPLYSLASGGLIFGAFFMATDPVTSPECGSSRIFYGISCALFTLLFRAYSSYPEGVMFAVVLSNALAPLFDQLVYALRYPLSRELDT